MSCFFHPELCWGDFLNIVSYFTLNELYWHFGRLNRNGFILFLRERALRKCRSATTSLFLTHGLNHRKVLLVSYPRSGNSYLRKLLESRLGIATGSDSRPNRTLTQSLLECGFKGEGIVDDSVWIVKTHFPERMGYRKVSANAVVLLIRNPFDTIESYFHMAMTNTHDKNLSESSFEKLSKVWPEFVRHEVGVWFNFYVFWLNIVSHVPVFVVRYEDLLSSCDTTLKVSVHQLIGQRLVLQLISHSSLSPCITYYLISRT